MNHRHTTRSCVEVVLLVHTQHLKSSSQIQCKTRPSDQVPHDTIDQNSAKSFNKNKYPITKHIILYVVILYIFTLICQNLNRILRSKHKCSAAYQITYLNVTQHIKMLLTESLTPNLSRLIILKHITNHSISNCYLLFAKPQI